MRQFHGNLFIAASALFYGFITVGGRWLADGGCSLLEVSFYPLLLTALLLSIFRPGNLRLLFHRAHLPFFLTFGLIGAALQVTQYGGIVMGIPVAIVALLLYLQPMWTLLISRVCLGETITGPKLAGLLLCLGGVLILLAPAELQLPEVRAGLTFALAAGMVLSCWVLWGKRSEQLDRVSPLVKTHGYALFSSLWLLPAAMAAPWLPLDRRFVELSGLRFQEQFWPIVAVALFAYLIPSCLFLAGVRHTEASTAGLLLVLEPLSAAVLAFLLLGQSIGWATAFGGSLILAANLLVLRPRKERSTGAAGRI